MISFHPLNKIKIAGTVVLALVTLVAIAIKTPDHVIASSSDNVHGWLWSDMPDGSNHAVNPPGTSNQFGGRGFGYIAMNSTEGIQCSLNQGNSSCPDYGVKLDMVTGELSGQAWSENGGWLNFDAGYPSGSINGGGVALTSAKIMPSCWNDSAQNECKVIGWARFSSGGTPQSGGWDGWVSMNSDSTITPQYHVMYNKTTGQFSGEAWGDMVAGWIDFSNVYADPKVPADLCENISDSQTTVPQGLTRVPLTMLTPNGGTVIKYFCLGLQTDLTCVDTETGTTITYPVSDPMPSQCKFTNDPNGPNQGIDLCVNITGTQSILPTFFQGTWYNDPNNDTKCTPMTNPPILGCMNPAATNYNPQATVSDGSCEFSPSYCTLHPEDPACKAGPLNPVYIEN